MLATMFFCALGATICLGEKAKGSYDAHKYKSSGEYDKAFKAFRHEFKPSKELQDRMDDYHKKYGK